MSYELWVVPSDGAGIQQDIQQAKNHSQSDGTQQVSQQVIMPILILAKLWLQFLEVKAFYTQ